MHLYDSLSITNLIAKKSILKRFLSQERKDSECFSVSTGVCAAFHAQERPETAVASKRRFLMGLRDRLIGSKVFIVIFR